MKSSGITWGVAASAVVALAVGSLPILAGTAHAVVTTVVIVNERDRVDFDTDELRDNDDFTIETRNELGAPANEGVAPEYRWVLAPSGGGTRVEGLWLTAAPRAKGAGRFQVYGPSSNTQGADGISDEEVQDGTWTLEARVDALQLQDALDIRTAESEITLAGGDAEIEVTGEPAVAGALGNANGGLEGREVEVTYAPDGGSGAQITGGTGNIIKVLTDADGNFSVTLEGGGPGDSGTLSAVATGESAGDGTQLRHRTGPDDEANPGADAADSVLITWSGTTPPDRTRIVAALGGRSNGARDDRLKVAAPARARGAEVRLLRKSKDGRLRLVQVRVLNRFGDRKFVVGDRNGRRLTQYVAVVRSTSKTLGDRTNGRRVR